LSSINYLHCTVVKTRIVAKIKSQLIALAAGLEIISKKVETNRYSIKDAINYQWCKILKRHFYINTISL